MTGHAKKCASFTHKYHGDPRNLPGGNEMNPCDCDGNHTFDELYEHRFVLYMAFCKQLSQIDDEADEHGMPSYLVWRSKLHSDGSSFCDWFILGLGKEKGEQITYHLPMSKWDETDFAETLELAPEYDGHTSDDVLERLKSL